MSRTNAVRTLAVVLMATCTGCLVGIPDQDDGEFACRRDDHCDSDYRCGAEGICVPEEDKDALPPETNHPCGDCDTHEACVRMYEGGPWECRFLAAADGTGGHHCDNYPYHAPIEAYTYSSGDGYAQMFVCKRCPVDCAWDQECTVFGSNSGYFQEIAVQCLQVTSDCSQCGSQACIHLNHSGDIGCMPRCDPYGGDSCDTNSDSTCVAVSGPNGAESVCMDCQGCYSTECTWLNPGAGIGPLEEIQVDCMEPPTEGPCDDLGCDFETQECIQLFENGPWQCVAMALGDWTPGYYCENTQSAYIEALGRRPGDTTNINLAVCKPCPRLCNEPMEECAPVHTHAPLDGYFIEAPVACRPVKISDCSACSETCVAYDSNAEAFACVPSSVASCPDNSQVLTVVPDEFGNPTNVCLSCPFGCSANQTCSIWDQNPPVATPIDDLDLTCLYPVADAVTCDVCNNSGGVSQCVAYSSGDRSCLAQATATSGYQDCPDPQALGRVEIWPDTEGSSAWAMCLECPERCNADSVCEVVNLRGQHYDYIDHFIVACVPG